MSVPQELVSRILALCGYVGDHGGGDRTRCSTRELIDNGPCPSCSANKIADDLTQVAGMTHAE